MCSPETAGDNSVLVLEISKRHPQHGVGYARTASVMVRLGRLTDKGPGVCGCLNRRRDFNRKREVVLSFCVNMHIERRGCSGFCGSDALI